jgi:membrane-bound ClpP family serine protease
MPNSPTISSVVFILLTSVCCLLFFIVVFIGSFRIVPEGKRLQLFRLGRFAGERGPGLVILIPFIERGILIDVVDQMNRAKGQFDFSNVTGETITPVFSNGSVLINNEPWNAISEEPISEGEKIRVIGVVLKIARIQPFTS